LVFRRAAAGSAGGVGLGDRVVTGLVPGALGLGGWARGSSAEQPAKSSVAATTPASHEGRDTPDSPDTWGPLARASPAPQRK